MAVSAAGSATSLSNQLILLQKRLAADEKTLTRDLKSGASPQVRAADEALINADIFAINALLARQNQVSVARAASSAGSSIDVYA